MMIFQIKSDATFEAASKSDALRKLKEFFDDIFYEYISDNKLQDDPQDMKILSGKISIEETT